MRDGRGTIHLSVVVAAGVAGRAILATLRSIAGARSVGVTETIVTVDAAHRSATSRVIAAAGFDVSIVVAEGRTAQRNAGAEAASAAVVAMLDAGDLIGPEWLSRAVEIVTSAGDDVIVHPERVLAFGDITADWPQPAADTPDVRRLLPVVMPFASAVVAAREVFVRVPYPATTDATVDAAWLAATFGAGVRHVRASLTSVFARTERGASLWRLPEGPSLPAIPWLRDAATARSAPAPRNGVRERAARGSRVLRAAGRALPSVVQPWRSAGRLVAGRLRALDRFPPWFVRDWRAANLIEPLVPYPRAGSVARLERWGAPWPRRERDAADAYWRFVDALPGELDFLFVGPWVRMGGGDTVLLSYIDAVRRLEPDASIALLTTEPVVSTRLSELAPSVNAMEARTLLSVEADRADLVERVLPMVLAQYRPTTFHAINSTVAFDVVEEFGEAIAAHTRIFLSSFAIDRAADGERTSVMFLRRPGFLDPVQAVLVDSDHYVDRLVHELGYEREKFVVQNSVIDVPFTVRSGRPAFDADHPLRLLWVGRFDIPKRIDVLARIMERASSSGMPVELHFHGAEVMGDPTATASLTALATVGAVRHPPFDGFANLPLEEYDAYILTSEWEGVPTSLLEAMAAGLPVIAPLVGGVGEVLDPTTGSPVPRFDDVDGYIAALQNVIDDYAGAVGRSVAARALVERAFSQQHFDQGLRAVTGYLPHP